MFSSYEKNLIGVYFVLHVSTYSFRIYNLLAWVIRTSQTVVLGKSSERRGVYFVLHVAAFHLEFRIY